MDIRVAGSNLDIGQSLNNYACNNLEKVIGKYFQNAISGDIRFTKNGQMFHTSIIINEGVKGRGITIKSDGEAGDVYVSFNEAMEKVIKQLRRYKERIKEYRHQYSIKNVETNVDSLLATKYIVPPMAFDIFSEYENEEIAKEKPVNIDSSIRIINEKESEIENLSIEQAIMKMDLLNLPALAFINNKNGKINFVYHRKDGNISWIDPQK
ncbi:MAG: ribosome-associated translation inhibitor RaiA [Rickettsiales bacterium]|nr:ribosome-associated translation inhibitor RaiA [Rickettsiales bacterium]